MPPVLKNDSPISYFRLYLPTHSLQATTGSSNTLQYVQLYYFHFQYQLRRKDGEKLNLKEWLDSKQKTRLANIVFYCNSFSAKIGYKFKACSEAHCVETELYARG